MQPAPDPNPIAAAMLEGATSLGIPAFADQNGAMMKQDAGCAFTNVRIRDGKRLSIFRTYLYPYMDRPNLTVLTGALVTRVIFEHERATAVDVVFDKKTHRFGAGREVILSLGAIQTPKILMQSGIGDQQDLHRAGIELLQHLPGVGGNVQDHLLLAGCVWEYEQPLPARNNLAEAVLFSKAMQPSTRQT